MSHYSVYTRQWEEVVVILDDGTGPWEPVYAYVEVEAATAREAKVLAVRQWRTGEDKAGQTYIRDCTSDERSPFTGLKAGRWCDACWGSPDKVCPKHDVEETP